MLLAGPRLYRYLGGMSRREIDRTKLYVTDSDEWWFEKLRELELLTTSADWSHFCRMNFGWTKEEYEKYVVKEAVAATVFKEV